MIAMYRFECPLLNNEEKVLLSKCFNNKSQTVFETLLAAPYEMTVIALVQSHIFEKIDCHKAFGNKE